MNITLLCKWWWKLETEGGNLARNCQTEIYKTNCLPHLKYSPRNFPLWNDLLKVKDVYLKGRNMVIGKGKSTDFWSDVWCGTVSLKDKLPRIFNDQFVHYMKYMGRTAIYHLEDDLRKSSRPNLEDYMISCSDVL